jgi:putative proteasome-type protease
MTYCVALCLEKGMVFLSDTRTNAGVDAIGTFRKMVIFEKDKNRLFTMMSSGNFDGLKFEELAGIIGLS